MKLIKLTGREMAVLRAMESVGSTGSEIQQRTQILGSELTDILNALCDVGYMEAYLGSATLASMNHLTAAQMPAARYEINPSYAQELKRALLRL